MNCHTFHENLLGQPPTPDQTQLYEAFEKNDVRGYDDPELNGERFLAVLVLALYQTAQGMTVILINPDHRPWVINAINRIAAHCFKIRNGEDKTKLKEAFKRLAAQPYLMFEPPAWVSFGLPGAPFGKPLLR